MVRLVLTVFRVRRQDRTAFTSFFSGLLHAPKTQARLGHWIGTSRDPLALIAKGLNIARKQHDGRLVVHVPGLIFSSRNAS